MKLNLPDFVKNVLNTLKENGYEAFVVGGSIRDIIMGKTPFDFDIATNALPNDVINIFDKTIPTGIKHGTVTVMSHNNAVEVTTYRTDNGYLDSRHPESVSFVSSIEEDLSIKGAALKSGFVPPGLGIVNDRYVVPRGEKVCGDKSVCICRVSKCNKIKGSGVGKNVGRKHLNAFT